MTFMVKSYIINPLGSGPGYVNLFFLSPNLPNTPTTTRRFTGDVPLSFFYIPKYVVNRPSKALANRRFRLSQTYP